MYVLTELGYVLICQVKEKEKKSSFENALVEKSESSTRNKNEIKSLIFLIYLNYLKLITFVREVYSYYSFYM